MNNITLSDGEWKLMSALWDKSPCSLSCLVKHFEGDTDWSKSTIFIMLKRLMEKGAVSLDTSDKVQLYSPTIDRNDATVKETKSFLSKLYGGSVGMMVSSLAGQRSLSEKDVEELRRILDEVENTFKKED